MSGRDGGTVSRTEMAEFAGVTTGAVSNWQRRHPEEFPRPVSGAANRFAVADVAAWLDRREIPAHSRQAGEPPGTTFGQRFRKNLSQRVQPTGAGEPAPSERFFRELQRSRYHLDEGVQREFVLSLIYLRAIAPRGWDRLRSAPPTAVRELLEGLVREHEISPVPDLDGFGLARTIALVDGEPPEHGVLFDRVLERFGGKRGSEFHTPAPVVRTMLALLDPQPGESVHDPWCGAGNLLTAALDAAGRVQVSGRAPSASSWRLARMNLELHGVERPDLGAGPANPLHERADSPGRFDVVLTNPPFGLREWAHDDPARDPRWRYGPPPSSRADLAWPQHCLNVLSPGGRAAVLMPAGASFRGGREQRIRTAMLRDGVVEAVLALPPAMFEATSIPVQIWLLRAPQESGERRVLLVDAGDLGEPATRTRRTLRPEEISRIAALHRRFRRGEPLNDVAALVVDSVELEARDSLLQPSAYIAKRSFGSGADRADVHRLSAALGALSSQVAVQDAAVDDALRNPVENSTRWAVRTLHEVCDVTAGPGTGYRTDPAGAGAPVLTPKDISDNRLDEAQPSRIADPDSADKLARYRLRAGDVVCVRTGALDRHALVTAAQEGWILGTGCLRLRPRCVSGRPLLDGRFLLYYLGTPQAQDWIARHALGATVPSLSAKVVRAMPVPVPPRDVQEAIAGALATLDDKIVLHRRIQRRAEELREALLGRLGLDDLPFGTA